MTEEAKKLRAAYQREYNSKHKEQSRAYHKKWHAEHPTKNKEYNARYWEKKAAEMKAAAESEQ